MKDVTSTSFGLLIAFFLPGFAGLFAISYWFSALHNLFSAFLEIESSVGLFFLVVFASAVVGLELTIIRWMLFEKLLCRNIRLQPDDFANLHVENKLISFRACVDEHYRYHQFWGSMAIVLPFLSFGWIWNMLNNSKPLMLIVLIILFIIFESLTTIAAIEAYRLYVKRAQRILKGG